MGRLRAPSLPRGYTHQFNMAMPPAARGDPGTQALWELVQPLGRQDHPVFQGKLGSECGCYTCHSPGICDMLVPPLPDSGSHRQISQANPEMIPASPPLQLHALVWPKEHMLYKDIGGKGTRRRTGEHFWQSGRTTGPSKGTETKKKQRKKSGCCYLWLNRRGQLKGLGKMGSPMISLAPPKPQGEGLFPEPGRKEEATRSSVTVTFPLLCPERAPFLSLPSFQCHSLST